MKKSNNGNSLPPRVVVVQVVDAERKPLPGAILKQYVNGKLKTTVKLGKRPASFEIAPASAKVRFVASYRGQSQERLPSVNSPHCVFIFEDPVRAAATSARVLIVTALPKEGAAVRALLDEVQSLGVDGDPTIYNVGSMSPPETPSRPRMVLLATQSDMGKSNAATIAANALRSFSGIEHIIMVGIAGGCPNLDPRKFDGHVRLGDIVACDFRGIIEYDDIKRTLEGVEYRGPAQRPSQKMLGAANQLDIRGDRPWERYIKLGLKRLPANYARPKPEDDRLRDPARSEEHPDGPWFKHPEDPKRKGREQWPRVHRGAIASADTLLKDEALRDELRDRFGVRAIEMEASGLQIAAWAVGKDIMVVRGVCDYCDKDKNDIWQEYAALVAAAYARALVEVLPQAWFH